MFEEGISEVYKNEWVSAHSLPSSEKTRIDLKVLTPSILLVADKEDLCLIARSGVGSRYLQTLVSLENRKLCEKMVSSIMSTNPLRMMTNPASCFLVEKLVKFIHILSKSQHTALLAFIKSNFSKLSLSAYGYHVVLAVVKHLGDEYKQPFILNLENPVLLISLLKSKYGTFVAQACVIYMQHRTIISVANSLLGHVVELGCHPSGTFFVQHFLVSWGVTKNLDLLVEHIFRHLRDFVHNPYGQYVIQSLIKSRNDTHHLIILNKWLVKNMMAAYKDKHAVNVIRCLLYQVSANLKKYKAKEWSKILDMLVVKMMESDEDGRPILIQAACHPVGHLVVVGVVRMLMNLDTSIRSSMLDMMNSYRILLSNDSIGNVVVKSFELL